MDIDLARFRDVRGATPDEIGLVLAELAAGVPKDQAIVELGVFCGRTALLMAEGAAQGHGAHVWGIDAWDLKGNIYDAPFTSPATRRAAVRNVTSLGYGPQVTLLQAFSAKAFATWELPIGLLFVDADHSAKGARDDITMWAQRTAPGATIAVDDYGHPDWPGVAEAVDGLVAEGFLEPIEVFHSRLAVTRLRTP